MKFTIRDLFLVTMIVALVVAWWVDRHRLSQTIKSQNAEVMQLRVELEVERAVMKAQLAAETARAKAELESVFNSSAPAPNPPKP